MSTRSRILFFCCLSLAPACSSDSPAPAPAPAPAPTPAAAPAPAPAPKAAKNEFPNQRVAFQLGWRLAMASIARSGGDADFESKQMKKVDIFARALAVEVPPLPAATGDSTKDLAAAIHYMLQETDALAATLAKSIGPKTKASFKLAMGMALLSKLWGDEKAASATLRNIEGFSTLAGVPRTLVQPLLDKAAARPEHITDEVFAFEKSVDTFLASAPDEARGQTP